jgi:phosphate transport system protein
MSRERFARQLEDLREDLLRLGNRVEHALQRSVRSIETWNTTLAAQVIQDDKEIDIAKQTVEERVIMLIATQQPVASDLRLLGSVFAIATELERIGDYASSIARRLQRVSSRPMLVTPPAGLSEMAAISQKMLNMSLEGFLRQDVAMVHRMAEFDDRVDQFEDRLREEMLELAQKEPKRIESILDILDMVHALERAADRATNIGERVIYLETNAIEELNP